MHGQKKSTSQKKNDKCIENVWNIYITKRHTKYIKIMRKNMKMIQLWQYNGFLTYEKIHTYS